MEGISVSIPEVDTILDKIRDIHKKKNDDYAAQGKQFENFERSAEIMSWFDFHIDLAFVWPIATKLARLATLLNKKRKGEGGPNNESVDDSFLDLVTYCILWWACYKRNDKPLVSDTSVYKCNNCGTCFDYSPYTVAQLSKPTFCSLQCVRGFAATYHSPVDPVAPTGQD